MELRNYVPAPNGSVDIEGLTEIFPELAKLDETEQDPKHHSEGNVGIHTRKVIEHITGTQAYLNGSDDDRFVYFYLALFHDYGKISKTKLEDGILHSRGHSRRGAIDTRFLLWREGVPRALRERICSAIALHQRPFHITDFHKPWEEPSKFVVDELKFALIKLSLETRLSDLLTLAEADAYGRETRDPKDKEHSIYAVEFCQLAALEYGVCDAPYSFPDDCTRRAYIEKQGRISPDYPFIVPHDKKVSRVTVLSGLPGTGKDTWIGKNCRQEQVVSPDAVREELGLDPADKDDTSEAIGVAQEMAKNCLREGRDFVWNATNISRATRTKILDLLHNYGAETTIVSLEASYEEQQRRNRARKMVVPEAVINRMLEQWEPPTLLEAHKVIYVDN